MHITFHFLFQHTKFLTLIEHTTEHKLAHMEDLNNVAKRLKTRHKSAANFEAFLSIKNREQEKKLRPVDVIQINVNQGKSTQTQNNSLR